FSGYAFGRSTILAEEVAAHAFAHGCPAVAIADPFSFVGCVEFAKACGRNGIQPLVGASFELAEGGELVLIARSKRGYVHLCRLITECHLGEPRNHPLATWERLAAHADDLVCLTGGSLGPLDRLLIQRNTEAAGRLLQRLIDLYGRQNVFVEVERSYLPWGNLVELQLLDLTARYALTPVAGGPVTHARPEHFPAQDILACSQTLCRVEEVLGRKEPRHPDQPQVVRLPERALNAERFLRSSDEMAYLFADRPDLVSNTLLVAERCDASVLPDRTKLPSLFGDDAQALRDIVEVSAFRAYPHYGKRQRARLQHEVDRIVRLGFASHFLIAWDVCRWSREQGIGMSGRGSVIDSAVAYVLGFSRIDAIRHRLHFDRFLPDDGSKRPDIDIDFEAHRRDDIRGYMVWKYGVERTATVAAVGAFNSRGVVREVGKAMGLPEEAISFLSKRMHGGVRADHLEEAIRQRPELRDSGVPLEKYRWVAKLAESLLDVPRNMRVHSSGVVVSDGPLADTVPLMWSATPASDEARGSESQLRMIQWDKRSAKHYFDKFDILCLRGQDVMSGVEERVRLVDSDFSVDRLDATDDREVYRAMRSGELIGIPQSASPAMRQAHVRIRTDNLTDASLVQAGIRPGVGGAIKINELIQRRRGKPFEYEHPDLEEILGKTYGIVVFQEQVDMLLQKFGAYTSGQAEDIRDAIHKRRREDYGTLIRDKLIERVLMNGYSPLVAEKIYELVAAYKGYGFAEGHALAFAEISLRCVYLMQNHPAEYFASLLSAQPAGYYGPCTIANEARTRGIGILHPDVCYSGEKFGVEAASEAGMTVPNAAIRTGLAQVGGLSKPTRDRLLEMQACALPSEESPALQPLREVTRSMVAVATMDRPQPSREPRPKPFQSFFDFVAKVRPARDELESLILCGALDLLCPNRRAMLWAIPAAFDYASLGLDADRSSDAPALPLAFPEPPLNLDIPDFSPAEKAVFERLVLGMDVSRHLMSFERERVRRRGGVACAEAKYAKPGTRCIVVGNPLRLRFPPTQSGKRVVFFDLEDETGLLNVTAFDDTYQRDGHAIVCSQYATVVGYVQDRDGYPAFLAHRVFPYKPLIADLQSAPVPIETADFLAR
ncbi:MAG TPA: PHP domain-containing protein, partial [Fimbriimonas sp.]